MRIEYWQWFKKQQDIIFPVQQKQNWYRKNNDDLFITDNNIPENFPDMFIHISENGVSLDYYQRAFVSMEYGDISNGCLCVVRK